MKLILGPMPKDPSFKPEDEGWTLIREPKPSVFLVIALLLGIPFSLALIILWLILTPIEHKQLNLLYTFIAFPCVIFFHELAHAVALAKMRSEHQTYFGFWPRRLAFYVHYTGPMSRIRYLTISILPYFLLSIVPLLICALLARPNFILMYASIANSYASCGDFAVFLIILRRVPTKAVIRQQSDKTWWIKEA